MTSLIPFEYMQTSVRTVEIDQQPWFVADDIAKALGYRDAANMVRNLDEDEADTHNVSTSGQNRAMLIINESGVYHAIFNSRRPEAKAFRRWVTHEVLPAIRLRGFYESRAYDTRGHRLPPFTEQMKLVAAAQRTFGKRAAQKLWADLGLPRVVDARPAPRDVKLDPLYKDVEQYAYARACIIAQDCAAEVMEPSDDPADVRQRVERILGDLGYKLSIITQDNVAIRAFISA